MEIAVRRGVGAIALLLAALKLPDALDALAALFSIFLPGFLEWEANPIAQSLFDWLPVLLWSGLALVAARSSAKILFILAAVGAVIVAASSVYGLLEFMVVARVAPAHMESLTGLPVWLYDVPLILVAAALLLSSDRLRQLGFVASAALVLTVGESVAPSSVGADGSVTPSLLAQVLQAGYLVAFVVLLLGIAHELLLDGRLAAPSNKRFERTPAR